MQELIERLDRWLRQNRPDYYNYLLPGLSQKELSDFEAALGVALPEDFKLLYFWKNGQAGQENSFFINFDWLKAEWVLSSSYNAPKVKADGFADFAAEPPEDEQGLKWVTFLRDCAHNDYILDLVGVYDNKPGQIISFWNDAIGCDEIIHPNLYKWLETVVIALERSLFYIDEEYGRLQEHDDYWELLRENNPGYPISTAKMGKSAN